MAMKCAVCGEIKTDVTYRVDPFQEDVYNEIVYRWLCDDCDYELYLDI